MQEPISTGERPIRVGIIGAGGNTVSRHIPGLQAIPGVEVASVCNRSRASGERVARQFDIPTVYEDWQELIAAPDTDAILIGTWPSFHCRATLAALVAHKHVLCEARMAMNAAEARAMRDAAQAKPRLVAQVVPSPMTLGVDRTIQRLIADGFLGEIVAVRIRDGNAFADHDAPLHWRQDIALSGVNIMSMGIWYEALLRWVGPARKVMAMGRTFTPMRRDAEGILRAVAVPDHVDVVAELWCGAQAHIQISAVTGMAGASEAWIFGTEGTVRFVDGRLMGARRAAAEWQEVSPRPEDVGGWRVEADWIDAIRGVAPVRLTTFDDGVRYMDFTEAVSQSIANGMAVALPLH